MAIEFGRSPIVFNTQGDAVPTPAVQGGYTASHIRIRAVTVRAEMVSGSGGQVVLKDDDGKTVWEGQVASGHLIDEGRVEMDRQLGWKGLTASTLPTGTKVFVYYE